ncbi:hypothetical protein Tco_1486221 [Tanacetum coccineum]
MVETIGKWEIRNENENENGNQEGVSKQKALQAYAFAWCFDTVTNLSFFRKIVVASNARVQDKALDALIAYLKVADAASCSIYSDMVQEVWFEVCGSRVVI